MRAYPQLQGSVSPLHVCQLPARLHKSHSCLLHTPGFRAPHVSCLHFGVMPDLGVKKLTISVLHGLPVQTGLISTCRCIIVTMCYGIQAESRPVIYKSHAS